jgi:D-serine deaminase-like pyridoxal phosphate-dependent protein
VKGQYDTQIAFLNEAHAVIHVNPSSTWQVGSRIEIIPNHACIPPSLADEMLAVRGELVESVIRVDARGKNR